MVGTHTAILVVKLLKYFFPELINRCCHHCSPPSPLRHTHMEHPSLPLEPQALMLAFIRFVSTYSVSIVKHSESIPTVCANSYTWENTF